MAFGAPVSGVLFSLEEASSYFEMHVLWQAFVCASEFPLLLPAALS